MAFAARVAGWLSTGEGDARAFAARQLVSLFNEVWNEDAAPIDADAFAGRIRLTDISISDPDGAALFYDDDDLFAGHVIIVSLGSDLALTDAVIAG